MAMNVVALAQTAKDLYENTILQRLREQLKEVGVGADGFGYSDNPDKAFAPDIGTILPADIQPSIEPTLPILPIETLLEQAGRLIDRVVAEDTSRRAMLIERLNLWLDLEEFDALDDINEEEITQGLYELPVNDTKEAQAGNDATKTWHSNVTDHLNSNRGRQQLLAAWSTEIAQRHTGGGAGQTNLFGSYRSTLPETIAQNKDVGEGATDGWLGAVVSYEAVWNQFEFQIKDSKLQEAISDARAPYLQKRLKYYIKDIDFRKRRRAIAQCKLHRKMVEASQPNGVLNYTPRIRASERRIAMDISAIYERLVSVNAGLSLLFDTRSPDIPTPAFGLVEQLVEWTRKAIDVYQWKTYFDTSSVIRISLSKALGPEFLSKLLRGASFSIDWNDLPDCVLARLRGASMSFAPKEGSKVQSLTLKVKPPSSASFRYGESPEPPADLKKQFLNYTPECVFGRVHSSNAAQAPDILGTTSWNNASPVGEWFAQILGPHPHGTPLADIDDIYLDILLVCQTTIRASAATPVLRRGDRNASVSLLQTKLNAAGYQVGTDGDFGPGTDAAVKQFQAAKGLTADGIVGPRTWAALG